MWANGIGDVRPRRVEIHPFPFFGVNAQHHFAERQGMIAAAVGRVVAEREAVSAAGGTAVDAYDVFAADLNPLIESVCLDIHIVAVTVVTAVGTRYKVRHRAEFGISVSQAYWRLLFQGVDSMGTEKEPSDECPLYCVDCLKRKRARDVRRLENTPAGCF